MSYVLANTASNLGRRGLGRGLGRMGWDNPPYTFYPLPKTVRNLNGLGDQTPNGAITYRIDPQSGKYNFYRTDLKPRGVFMQNTFQHPAPPVVSALRRPIRGITSREPIMALSGLGCGSCGGTCNTLDGPRFVRRRRRGMGDDFSDLFAGSSSSQLTTTTDANGNIVVLPTSSSSSSSVDPFAGFTDTSASDPSNQLKTVRDANGNLQVVPINTPNTPAAIAQAVQTITAAAARPQIVVQQPTASWFNGVTMVGTTPVPNMVLASGAALLAVALGSMGGGKRR